MSKAPGVYTRTTNIGHYLVSNPVFLPGGVILSGQYSRDIENTVDANTTYIRNGSLICWDPTQSVFKMGNIGYIGGDEAAAQTSITTSSAAASTEILRQIGIGTTVGVGFIGCAAAVDTLENTIGSRYEVRVADAATPATPDIEVTAGITYAYADESYLTGGWPVGLLYTNSGDSVHVNDEDGANIDVQVEVLIGGVIRGLALPYPGLAALQGIRAALGHALNQNAGSFVFIEDVSGVGFVHV